MGRWCLVACVMAAVVFSASLLSASLSSSSEKLPPLSIEEVLSLGDELEFAAIQAIHSQLDDNHDGQVDLSESEEFVQTELCGDGGVGEGHKLCFSSEKSKRFHKTDKQITSMELWTAWHTNEVFNWTTDDVVFWLTNHVHLPQYAELFRRHKITGRLLPKLATNSGQILQSVLFITDGQHRQKIQLRAMDAILFGPPHSSGYWKDIIMTLSILLCVWGVLYALRQRWIAQSRIDSFLEDFQAKEEELVKLRSKLEHEEMIIAAEEADSGRSEGKETPPNSLEGDDTLTQDDDLLSEVSYSRSSSLQADPESSLIRAHDEIESLHRKVLSLESQLEADHSNMSLLQSLLQDSCKREWEHLEVRKRMAEEQMTRAEKVCDKIKKRRSSLFGSLHLANSSTLEDAGLQITKAVNNMQAISECFDEYHKRWRRVEHICGFQVCSSPSSPTHNHTHSSAHKYEPSSYISTGSDSSGNSLSTLDGISLRQGAAMGGDAPLRLHRSSTLPRFRSNSFSLSENESLFYYKPRPSSVSSSSSVASSSTGSAYFKSLKSVPPLIAQTSAEVGNMDTSDMGYQSGSSQCPPPQLQHHQLHLVSASPPSSKKPETDIAEYAECPKHVRRKMKTCSSVPALLVRKDSYSEAICSGEDGRSASLDGEQNDGITFLASSGGATKTLSLQQSSNQKSSGGRSMLNGLEAIREERNSQFSLNSSGSSDSGSSDARAGSSSPDKPRGKGRSQSPRAGTIKSMSAINRKAISSEV